MSTSDLADEISRLANQIFAQLPGGGTAAPPATGSPAEALPLSVATPGLPTAVPVGGIAPVLVAAPLGGSPRPIPPAAIGPNALNVGAGGVSGAQTSPPTPGWIQQPPLTSTPVPRESDLRGLPAAIQGQAIPTPVVAGMVPAAAPPGLYFLDIAGPPAAAGGPSAPSGPSEPSGPSLPLGAGGMPSMPSSTAPDGYFLSPLDRLPLALVPGLEALPARAPTQEAAVPAAHAFAPDLGRVTQEARPTEVPALPTSGRLVDGHVVKRDFPILRERVHGRQLVWLDNAATTQKPQSVIDRLSYYYEHENSNVHRAAHAMAARATDAYEAARDKVRDFLHAPSSKNIVFVRGATEAINLVAQSWGRRNVRAGDEIVITWLEHHANIVPWQQLASETGAKLVVVPVDDHGQVILEEYERRLSPKTRLVSVTHVSNALGTVVPVKDMTEMAHRYGARVLIDGAQSVSHMPVDVQALGCDFYCFSGHKVFAPTGIGVLFGKAEVLETMPPWQGGGNMIEDVTFEQTRYQPAPLRFEAGTGSIADAVGLGAAIDYLQALGIENVTRYEHELLAYGTQELARVPGLRLIGTAPDKAGVLSFVVDGLRTEDIGSALDQEGIAVRSGHHCAQPILRRFGLESSVRASLAPYNTGEDIDALVAALLRLKGRDARRVR